MPRHQTRYEADDLFKLDMPWLKRNGYLMDYKSSIVERTNNFTKQIERINLVVSISNIPEETYVRVSHNDISYQIQLVKTPCHYGGYRFWFLCPLITDGMKCDRRVGVLYKLGDYFMCRHHGLTYHSKRLNKRCWAYPYEQVITLQKKIRGLEATMNKRTYQGILTKKAQRLERLYHQYGDVALRIGELSATRF